MASNNVKDNGQDGSKRGFASMDDDKQRKIASEGGKAAHEKGAAHKFDSETAREAGSKSHGGGNSGSHDKSESSSSSTRGGTSEQHAKAGSQSHKNK